MFFQVRFWLCLRSLGEFPREILALQGRLFQDAEEENSPGLLILPTFSLPTWRLSWLWEKVFVLPALKFFPVFGGGPGKSQSVQVQREKGIYGAQRTTSLRLFLIFHPYSPSPLHFLRDSALFSLPPSPPRWIQEGFVGQIRFCVPRVLGEGRAAHESKRSFYNQSNQSGQLRADPRAWKGGSRRGKSSFHPGVRESLGKKKEYWEKND